MWRFTFPTANYSTTGLQAGNFLGALDVLPASFGTKKIVENIESTPNITFTKIPTVAAPILQKNYNL
ncbi:hypothetical protein ACFWMS_23360 [Peribacillus butanolivorans]|uniref:hypothetical protein n=1 Tax=Peribacillus butanolivorans TaxID=421767 RepID=UPI003664D8AD